MLNSVDRLSEEIKDKNFKGFFAWEVLVAKHPYLNKRELEHSTCSIKKHLPTLLYSKTCKGIVKNVDDEQKKNEFVKNLGTKKTVSFWELIPSSKITSSN